MTERIVSNSAFFFHRMRCYFWKDEQTEILILDLLRAAAASCRSGSLSQHFTEGFAPRGYFKVLGAVEQSGLQWGCAEHPLCTTGSWQAPCSMSQLCQSEPTTAQVHGWTGFSLWFNTLTAVYNSSRKSLPFFELFPVFLPPEEVLWEFSWVCKSVMWLSGCAGPQLFLIFWESSVTFTEQDDRNME